MKSLTALKAVEFSRRAAGVHPVLPASTTCRMGGAHRSSPLGRLSVALCSHAYRFLRMAIAGLLSRTVVL